MSIREFAPTVTEADVARARAVIEDDNARVGHMRFVEAKWAFRDSWKVIVAGAGFLTLAGIMAANGISGWLVTGSAILGVVLLLASVPTLLWGLLRAGTRKSTAATETPEQAMATYYGFALDRPLRSFALVAPGARAGVEPRAFETEWRAAREVIADSIRGNEGATCATCEAHDGPGVWTAETYGVPADDNFAFLRCPKCESVVCGACATELSGFLNKKCGNCGHKLGKAAHVFVSELLADFEIGQGRPTVVADRGDHMELEYMVPVAATFRLPWMIQDGGVARRTAFGGLRPDFDTPSIGDRATGLVTRVLGGGGAPKVVHQTLEPSVIAGGAVSLRFRNTAVKLDDGWHLVAHEPGQMTVVAHEEAAA